MTSQLTFPVVCISESELLQWVARGRIHLLLDRVIQDPLVEGVLDVSLFASCPVLKLDDAKGRVWVSLNKDSVNGSRAHPYAHYKNVLDLPITDIQAVGAILPQYKRRLENIQIPVSDSTLEAEWETWLTTQGAHERFCAIQQLFKQVGFELPKDLDMASVKMAMRPNHRHEEGVSGLEQWRYLLSHRDEILQKLRFEGHAGEKSFFAASIQILLEREDCLKQMPDSLFLPASEGVWQLRDLSTSVLSALQEVDNSAALPLLVKAAYLRSFEDLHYGEKDWVSIFNLARYIKYSIGGAHGSELLFFLLSSVPVEEIIGKKLATKF